MARRRLEERLNKMISDNFNLDCMLPSIGLVGKNGSGKTTCAKYIIELHPEYSLVSTGPLWDEYFGKNLTSADRTEKGTEVIQKKGKDFFVRQLLLPRLTSGGEYVIDSIRDEVAFPILKDYFGGWGSKISFVGIVANGNLRFERLKSREGYTREKFDERERKDSIYNIDSLIGACDWIITNELGDIRFKNDIREALSRIMK